MGESAKRHEENSNLIKEIQASTDAAIRNQGASIKTLEIQIGQMSKVLQERGFGSLPSSTETNPRDHVKSISTIIEADSYSIRHMGSSQYAVSTGQNRTQIVSVMPLSTYLNLGLGELAHTKLTVELADRTVKSPKGIAENVLVGIGKFVFPIDFIILDMPEDIKMSLILGRPFLSTAHAKIDVFKRKITLRVREEKIIFKSIKPTRSLIKRVYMLSLRERMELDLEARLIGETLVLNRSLDPFFEDYIELNDLNIPLELRRDQVDDLMPIIEEGKVVEEFRARNDARLVSKFFGYPSDCDHDKKIRIDCAYNLKFSCMIDFLVLEDMDAYRDEGIDDFDATPYRYDPLHKGIKFRLGGMEREIHLLEFGWRVVYTPRGSPESDGEGGGDDEEGDGEGGNEGIRFFADNYHNMSQGTDKAKITRKWSKPDKHGHGNGRAHKEPEVFYKKVKKSAVVNPQSTLGQSHNKTKIPKLPNSPS
ncbi:mitochondrial proton/calcium exchanger protein-like protein isoform X1 [Tanacetum coccineum]